MEASEFYEAILSTYQTTLLHNKEGSEKFILRDFDIISRTVL